MEKENRVDWLKKLAEMAGLKKVSDAILERDKKNTEAAKKARKY